MVYNALIRANRNFVRQSCKGQVADNRLVSRTKPSVDRNPRVGATKTRPQFGARIKLPEALAFKLAAGIEQQIIYLELKPDAHLVERDVCAAYGVSRSPVRDAFRQMTEADLDELSDQHEANPRFVNPNRNDIPSGLEAMAV